MIVVLAAVAFSAVGAAAATDCRDPQDQTSMNICADQDRAAADRALNAAYAALLARTDKANVPKLRAAERAWVAYRDAECGFETAGSVGGTIHPLEYSGCVEVLTKAQTARLQQVLTAP
jgi:uncharacterized protein YecT (DUF1311 family)